MKNDTGFFGALFDFSFSQFITTRIIKFLYILAVVLLGLGLLLSIISQFATRQTAGGIVTLILSPLIFLLGVIAIRVYLELVIVIFRIAEHTRDIALRERREP